MDKKTMGDDDSVCIAAPLPENNGKPCLKKDLKETNGRAADKFPNLFGFFM